MCDPCARGAWPNRQKSCIGITLIVFGCMCFVGWAVTFGLYFHEKHDLKYYRETSCKVLTSQVYADTCSTQDCYGSGRHRHCHTDYYTCYGAEWRVTYPIQDGHNDTATAWIKDSTESSSSADATDDLSEYRVGSTYSCWYDSESGDQDEVQWKQPNPLPFLISFIVLGSVAFLMCLGPCIGCCQNRCCKRVVRSHEYISRRSKPAYTPVEEAIPKPVAKSSATDYTAPPSYGSNSPPTSYGTTSYSSNPPPTSYGSTNPSESSTAYHPYGGAQSGPTQPYQPYQVQPYANATAPPY